MARKKKEIKEKAEVKSTGGIGYQGRVSVKVMNGKKVIASRTSHNTGCAKLWDFICKCISGSFIRDDRPCRLALFNRVDNDDMPDDPKFTDSSLISSIIPVQMVSPPQETVDENGQPINGKQVVFSFSIPSTYIFGTEIYKLALCPQTIANFTSKDELDAYYLFKNNDGNWDPFSLEGFSGNYSLVVEWIMVFTNK